jgi:hypothetical protein
MKSNTGQTIRRLKAENKQLRIGIVSQQRELLSRFLKYYNQDDLTVSDEIDIDLFLNDNKPIFKRQ